MDAHRYGPWALIAGASEGVGASFARKLAKLGVNLVLVARRAEPLAALAQDIRAASGVEIRTLTVDLSHADMLARIRTVTDDIDVGLLVFNAGATDSMMGAFLDKTLDEVLIAPRVTVLGQTALAHHFGARMAAHGRGGIILLGSLSGNAGAPNAATYCGAKAYSQIFAEALWCELKPRGVDVLSLVLGFTDTPALARQGADARGMPVLSPDDVAQQALDNLAEGGPVHVPPQYQQMFQYFTSTPRRQLVERFVGAKPS